MRINKFTRVLICILLAIPLFSLVASLAFRNHPTTPSSSTYSITYQMVSAGKVQDVYEPLFKDGGSYPTRYKSGETVTVSDLSGRIYSSSSPYGTAESGAFADPNNPNRDFSFYGWFLDEACTIPLENNTVTALKKDLTLFAKVTIGYWTAFY